VVEHRQPTPDGDVRAVRSRLTPVRDADGRVVRVAGLSEDVTGQRELEGRLRQAQRMEAVGQLAGGIAHDFNNLLSVITGNLELLAADLPPDLPPTHPAREDADEIARAATRARHLVRHLLAFSRKQPARPQHLRVGELVRNAEKLLRRVIGEEIALEVHVGEGEAAVHVDAGQLEQVLINLAVNARDAMLTPLHGHPGTGGVLAIEVDALALDAAEARQWETTPGPWVRLRVRDTGHGMDAATRVQAFEPFFTTKDVGRGTGLGLSTVFGIVRQARGVVRVDSVPGGGTTFTVLLPAAAEDGAAAAGTPPPRAAAGSSTVLLVEDEAPVRAVARRLLERRGYTVLEARHGADALDVWRAHGSAVEVVITDVRMPELGGRELVARLRAERPRVPVVYMSGYADEGPRLASGSYDAFVEKPFTSEALFGALDGVLRAGRPA
jgi:signal transduction histidine kinase/CheY-like chemotaxis protein